jgi:glycosyltransferase involved in cell wall biosynthesis
MKILILQDQLRSGGTERQSILLTRAFEKAGHFTKLLTFRPGGELASMVKDLRHDVLQPFDCHADWFAPGLFSAIHKASPDVVLCMGRIANCYAGLIGNLTRKNRRPILVVGSMRTGKKLPWLFRRSLTRVGHIVANSYEAKEILVKAYGVAEPTISVIHNSLVFPAPLNGVGPIRNETLDTLAPVNLVWVGMFREEKNQRELIEIVGRLPSDLSWQLTFAGDGPCRADCIALVEKLQLTDRVKFIGFTKNPSALYESSDVAVLTSKSESLSNFLIEAQAYGLPVVAYDAGGVRECLRDGETGFIVKTGDQSGFLERLEQLVRERSLRLEQSAKARVFAREAFSPEHQVSTYLELFTRLTERGTPKP